MIVLDAVTLTTGGLDHQRRVDPDINHHLYACGLITSRRPNARGGFADPDCRVENRGLTARETAPPPSRTSHLAL